jgi:hypothetical protein
LLESHVTFAKAGEGFFAWHTNGYVMSILASDFTDLTKTTGEKERLGDALAGEASELDVDSVAAVRELRERE